jgi:hypothetical protein
VGDRKAKHEQRLARETESAPRPKESLIDLPLSYYGEREDLEQRDSGHIFFPHATKTQWLAVYLCIAICHSYFHRASLLTFFSLVTFSLLITNHFFHSIRLLFQPPGRRQSDQQRAQGAGGHRRTSKQPNTEPEDARMTNDDHKELESHSDQRQAKGRRTPENVRANDKPEDPDNIIAINDKPKEPEDAKSTNNEPEEPDNARSTTIDNRGCQRTPERPTAMPHPPLPAQGAGGCQRTPD